MPADQPPWEPRIVDHDQARLPPSSEWQWAPDVEPDDGFWTTRPVLDHVRTFARARRVSPWAVLGVVLARITTAVPPFVVLPALVGGHGSLNLFIGLVGNPGAGKGTAECAAADAVDLGCDIETAGVGSGEGIAHMFCTRAKDGVNQHAQAVMFTVAEIDTLTALGDRRGSTLLPELRKAWSGERLGFAYADPTKRLPLPAHAYRLGVVAGIQPERAGHLLDDRDAGTPQRFLWLPATDPHAPDIAPDEPLPLQWRRPTWPTAEYRTSRAVLPVCDTARDIITRARLARVRGEDGDDLDGHLLYAHLKTAAALALLDSRSEVTDDDWKLADEIMGVSARTREAVVEQVRDSAADRNRKQGAAQGLRDVIAEQTADEERTKKVCTNIVRRLRAADGDGMAHNELRRGLKNTLRDLFDEAIERLVSSGQVTTDAVDGGHKYRLTGS